MRGPERDLCEFFFSLAQLRKSSNTTQATHPEYEIIGLAIRTANINIFTYLTKLAQEQKANGKKNT